LAKDISNLDSLLVQTNNTVFFSDEAFAKLQDILDNGQFSKVFFMVDENTHDKCLPYLLQSINELPEYEVLEVEPGEESKTAEVLVQLWVALSELRADRYSLVVNVGGGMITDLGGFLAGTYMRGVSFVNVPTSLLAMVDASSGGKTGINLGYLKNRVGLFLNPMATLIVPEFLETLPYRERRSGFAEMLKHGLIADASYWQELIDFDIEEDVPTEALIARSVQIKQQIVGQDFRESGWRKTLNFGHTVGHAIETASLETPNPLMHGEAIALGMMVELQLSEKYTALDPVAASDCIARLKAIYHDVSFEYDIDYLIELIRTDKKNKNSEIRFSLLREIGEAVVDVNVKEEGIREVLNQRNS
jgi:3-dehydroquinate synthase